MSVLALCVGCSLPFEPFEEHPQGRRITRTMAAALSAQQSVPHISVAHLEPQLYGTREHASLDPLFERIRDDRVLHGALPSQSGSFHVIASHGFRGIATRNLWDAWPSYLGRVPAVDAGMQEFVGRGRAAGLVPAVCIDFHADETVAQVLLRMNQVFWGPDGAPSTYLARKEHLGYGGCWGFLVQFRGAPVELLAGVPYTTGEDKVHRPMPVLAVRKSLAVPFALVKQNLQTTAMASLGLHAEAAHITAFRFLQRTTADRKFLKVAEDVLTVVKRTAAGGGGGGGGGGRGGMPMRHLMRRKQDTGTTHTTTTAAAVDDGAAPKRQRRNDGSAASSSGKGPQTGPVEMPANPSSAACLRLVPWPLHGFVMSQVLGGRCGVKSMELHRAHVGLLTFLGLECNPKPVFNLLALVCARILPVLPESLIDTYQQLRQRWWQEAAADAHEVEATTPWGPRMEVRPWSSAGAPDAPQDCVKQYIVSLPETAEQMRGLENVDQRLALLAAALGVPALVVNGNLTKEQCSNFHRIVEAIAPWIGINSAKWCGVEKVMSGLVVTRTRACFQQKCTNSSSAIATSSRSHKIFIRRTCTHTS